MAIPAAPQNLRLLTTPSSQIANMREVVTRRTRQITAHWQEVDAYGFLVTNYLQDPVSHYWDPQSLKFNDALTGVENWIVMRTPAPKIDRVVHGADYDQRAWNRDGSILAIGVQTTQGVQRVWDIAPGLGGVYCFYVVHPDGGKLCKLGIPGTLLKGSDQQGIILFANTEDAFYFFVSDYYATDDRGLLYKATYNKDTLVVTVDLDAPILDTFLAAGGGNSKGLGLTRVTFDNRVKHAISNDDNKLLIYGGAQAWGKTSDPDGSILYIQLNQGVAPTILAYWGLWRPDRDEYGGDDPTYKGTSHNGSMRLVDWVNDYMVTQGEGHQQWWMFKLQGTSPDGGPKWEDWNGVSYGANELVPISKSGIAPQPPDPDCQPYWQHPCFDRWGKYLFGVDGVIVDWRTGLGWDGTARGYVNQWIPAGFEQGNHCSWAGWCDSLAWTFKVIAENSTRWIYAQFIDFVNNKLGPAWPVANVGTDEASDDANVSQSPDGTKYAYLNFPANSANNNTTCYECWVVAHYPFPGEITGASKVAGNVRLTFIPRKYTSRGYPTVGDSAPEPKEIRYWRVWTSTDKISWTEATDGSPVAFATRTYDHYQPNNSTRYYALTSEEYSHLESRRLGNIWKVVIDNGGNITVSIEDTAYPSEYALKSATIHPTYLGTGYQVGDVLSLSLSGGTRSITCTLTVATIGAGGSIGIVTISSAGSYSVIPQAWPCQVTGGHGTGARFNLIWDAGPGAIRTFYTTQPSAPTGFTAVHTATSGHFRLNWTEPADNKVRYYNIYYSNVGLPQATEAYRIASVPKGTVTWLDWCADPGANGRYGITSVDRQGNESTIVTAIGT